MTGINSMTLPSAFGGVGVDGTPEFSFFNYADIGGYRYYCDSAFNANGGTAAKTMYDFIRVDSGKGENARRK